MLCADTPKLISYQGKLSNKSDSTPLEGVQSITFKIYDALTGGSLLWQEIQNVLVEKGVFNVHLGSAVSLNLAFDKAYYLELKVGEEVISIPVDICLERLTHVYWDTLNTAKEIEKFYEANKHI